MNDPSPAASSAATVSILQDQDVVTVIERFDVPAAQQPEAVERATDRIRRGWKEDPGFVAAVLLRGRERGGISSYSQWELPADGSAPAAVPGAWSLEAALPAFAMLDSRTYTVEFTDSATPPTQVSLDRTPLAHFAAPSAAGPAIGSLASPTNGGYASRRPTPISAGA